MSNPTIGLKNIMYAILTSDTAASVNYSAFAQLAEAATSKIVPKITSDVQWFDDSPIDIIQTQGETTIELNLRDVPLSVQAALLGHSYANGTITKKYTDLPPFVAIAFKSIKADKTHIRYMKLLKGKFELIEMDNESVADKTKVQSPTLKGTFVKRIFDDQWQRVADDDDVTYVASVGTNWFSYVETAADINPPTITTVSPLNAATSVPITIAVVWTFSEAINIANLAQNFTLFNAATGLVIASTVTVNAAGTIVTLTPSASLTAAQAYYPIISRNVQDLQGNAIAAVYTTKFTC